MDTLEYTVKVTWSQRWVGWFIHAFTASGACVGLVALWAIYQHQLIAALWLMGAAILIDAVDGVFARAVDIKRAVPEIDGVLLDNMVDFVNYTMVPAFFLLVTDLLPPAWCFIGVVVLIFSSAYQFTQVDAKTSDHFFKGFPSYWNIVVFYLFFWQMSAWMNLMVVLLLAILSFVPIKYVYPSRLDYLSNNRYLRLSMAIATIFWGLATAGLLWLYPQSNHFLVLLSLGYTVMYIVISFYRTWVPLPIAFS